MRLRVRFTKLGKVRFLSHRDLARIWERALRRADLPVAYSQGFSPRPKLHFGLALSTGHESLGEYLDVDLDPTAEAVIDELGDLTARLSAVLPDGIDCTAVSVLDRPGPSLQEAVTRCTWAIELEGPTDRAEEAIAALLAAPSIVVSRDRKGRVTEDDIRPGILTLTVTEVIGSVVCLRADLGTQPRTLRPSELVAALGSPWSERRVCRLHQWIEDDGVLREPLAPAVTVGAS